MKVKDNDELINVIRLNEDQLISVLTHKGMSLTYSSEELSDTGLRAAGVKSINLKDEDFVVMTDVVDSDSSIIMATQRGAVKRISYKILQQAKRAQRGITLLKELKKNPHRVVAVMLLKMKVCILYILKVTLKKDKSLIFIYLNNTQMGHLLLMLKSLETS